MINLLCAQHQWHCFVLPVQASWHSYHHGESEFSLFHRAHDWTLCQRRSHCLSNGLTSKGCQNVILPGKVNPPYQDAKMLECNICWQLLQPTNFGSRIQTLEPVQPCVVQQHACCKVRAVLHNMCASVCAAPAFCCRRGSAAVHLKEAWLVRCSTSLAHSGSLSVLVMCCYVWTVLSPLLAGRCYAVKDSMAVQLKSVEFIFLQSVFGVYW